MKIATIILNVLLLLGLVPAIMGAMTSPMIFDSGQNPNLWRVFITMLALPVVIIICQIISWIAYFRQKYDFAFRVSIIPLVNLILLIIFMFSM
ncbi:hypothetical protein [Emticicia aquatilis]|uniref:hypothetical protein n=1 Tax=Emticicia aquatilis TaxID=1537369 RepID=UPI001662A2B1|nr:hypothetical protein [Emticicia aquatilis]